MKIDILFENDDFLVVNKPGGLMVHGDGRKTMKTLSDWFVSKYPEAKDVGEPAIDLNGEELPRPGIVHRLDEQTSGAILLVKNQEAFMFLKAQFQNRQIKKVYNAFVYGIIKDERGIINRPIGKSRKDPRMWSAQRGARGTLRDAITLYRVLARGSGCTYLELRPKTGRTHQIRVHLKAVNHPIVCDKLYAPKEDPVLGFSRLALHAASITFTDREGKVITIEAPFPDDFLEAQKML